MNGALLIRLLVWDGLATAVLTVLLTASQGLGLSRLSLPFLLGTFFVGDRHRAMLLGFFLYILGGALFALLYLLAFTALGTAGAWAGALLGALHGLFLLVVVLTLLPHFHPRMASEYDGPTRLRRLEPPGFIGLNYGWRTPMVTLLGHVVYGAMLGYGFG